ncbi:MAG: PASTA domain-containing protein [Gammaproteobacteria bacterium]|nr:PASTA domain-containing protein [Gammaproteobacteria bacterium]MCP5137271.1 PASTA domain-containing protein [Gammaproteobacteria bacterium]
MARFTNPTDLMDSLSAPLGDLISEVGRGVADAQAAMDSQTIARMKEIVAGGDELMAALRSIGYQPTWYQIPEATAKLSIALTISGEAQSSVQGASGGGIGRLRLNAAPVNADYSNKFNYQVQAASEIQFKIVPVPPSVAAEHLRAVPALVGKTLSEADELLSSVGLNMSMADPDADPGDDALVTTQNPDAGAIINDEVPVELGFD